MTETMPPDGAADPPSAPQTLSVAPDGSGDILTLAEAVAAAQPGATITLSPGEHLLARPLRITTPLNLVGAGASECETSVVCAGAGYVVEVEVDGPFSARGIAFRHTGDLPVHGVVHVLSGTVDLRACRFTGGAGGEPHPASYWSYGAGLRLAGDAVAVVSECRADGNAGMGILATGSARADLEACACEENAAGGIAYNEEAGGTARGNTCRRQPGMESSWRGMPGRTWRPTTAARTPRSASPTSTTPPARRGATPAAATRDTASR